MDFMERTCRLKGAIAMVRRQRKCRTSKTPWKRSLNHHDCYEQAHAPSGEPVPSRLHSEHDDYDWLFCNTWILQAGYGCMGGWGVRACWVLQPVPADCAVFFLDRLRLACWPTVPGIQDLPWCCVLTSGILETTLWIDKANFHVEDMGGQCDDCCKRIQGCKDVCAITFMVVSSGYNAFIWEHKLTNSLQKALTFF